MIKGTIPNGFADDLGFLIVGKYNSVRGDLMRSAFELIDEWLTFREQNKRISFTKKILFQEVDTLN